MYTHTTPIEREGYGFSTDEYYSNHIMEKVGALHTYLHIFLSVLTFHCLCSGTHTRT